MSSIETPLVSICSITYNHEPYIRQCLDGMLSQKTNFPFEIIINDDCSTDGTTEIIKEYVAKYPNIIRPIFHEENQYSKGVRGMFANFCFPKARGKYIALCEGDDYWTDPLKLQKQVDFLENNKEYSMCFMNAIQHYEDSTIADRLFSNIEDRDYSPLEIFRQWIIPTASVLLKTNVVTSNIYKTACANERLIFGDIILFLSCSRCGKLRGLNSIGSVYRRTTRGSVFLQRSSFEGQMKYLDHNLEIYRIFGPEFKKDCEIIYYTHCNIGVFNALKKYHFKEALQFLKKSMAYSVYGTLHYYYIKTKYYIKDRF